jgi:vacuolar-type H+-ATPase catalytic subunit A/Vma1
MRTVSAVLTVPLFLRLCTDSVTSEEGYPAYLASSMRAGRVETLGESHREGPITLIRAVSPPGGDFK